jgi:DNA-binding transcriptional MerR regulator
VPIEPSYTIADLARLTGVNVRTIRYYLAQGLLPASGESGPGAHYGEGHLDRLRLTKRLQAQHLPLSEIRQRLAELTNADVAGLVATVDEPSIAPPTSALDYVRSVLGPPPSQPAMSMPTSAAPASRAPAGPAAPRMARLLMAREAEPAMGAAADVPATVSQSPADPDEIQPMPLPRPISVEPGVEPGDVAAEPPAVERSQWERLGLGPNVELHVRRPLSRLEQRRVERLITIARQVLKEDMK